MPAQGFSGVVRFGVPGVLLGLVLMGGLGGGRAPRTLLAENLPGAERGRMAPLATGDPTGTLAFTTTLGATGQLLYIVDTKSRSFAIYRVDPTNPEGALKLEAARQYQWDLRLLEYNNQKPDVASVEASIKPLGHPGR